MYALALETLSIIIFRSIIKSVFSLTPIPHFLSSFFHLNHDQLCINPLPHQQRLPLFPLRHDWMLGAESTP